MNLHDLAQAPGPDGQPLAGCVGCDGGPWPQALLPAPDDCTGWTAEELADAIGVPLADWPGNCYVISRAVLDRALVSGVARGGQWVGRIAPGSYFHHKLTDGGRRLAVMPRGIRHGWVELDDGRVLDPTRWVFEGASPYVYVGPNRGEYELEGEAA